MPGRHRDVRAAAAEAAERLPPASAQRAGATALIEALVCDSPISAAEACARLQRMVVDAGAPRPH
jgi:hypothetical protein